MIQRVFRHLGIVTLMILAVMAFSGCQDAQEISPDNNNQQTTTPTNSSASNPTTPTTTPATTGDTIKIGAVVPLTGDGASLGEPLQKVAQIAIDEINAAGGINGKKMEFLWEDGKCNGNDGANAGNKLINVDQVKVIYGGFCSSETLAIAPIAEQNKVVVLSPASSSPDVTTAGDYIFRNYPSDSSQGKILAEVANKLGYKKVAIIAEQNDYTLGIQKVFQQRFEELGGKVQVQTYLPDDSDFKTSLLKLKGGNPDALLLDPQTPTKADLILKQFEEMKWKVKLLAIDVVAGYPDLLKKYSKTVEGMIAAEFSYDKNNPDFKKLADKFKAITGKEMPYGTYASTSYDAVYILKEAIEKVGMDSAKIKDYLYAIKDRKGLGGSLTFDKNGDPSSGHALEIIKDGKTMPYQS